MKLSTSEAQPNIRSDQLEILQEDLGPSKKERLTANLNSGSGEVGDLELDLDGRLSLDDLALDAGQAEVRAHQILLAARKRLDRPDDARLVEKNGVSGIDQLAI